MEPRMDAAIEKTLDEEIARLENSFREQGTANTADTAEQRLAELARIFGIRLQCRTCRRGSPDTQALVYCHACGHCFHSGCWADYDDHSTEFRDEPCTGSSPLALHLQVAHLHHSKVSDEVVLKSIASDRCHRWIGIADTNDTARDNSSIKAAKPKLLLYPTLTKLFTDSGGIVASQRPRKQYPRLVSFFGETGAGKSTVVKNLIRLLREFFDEAADVPVTSPSGQAESSTSSGVHVYTDPNSVASSVPIVYADCEGLGGAEPLASTGWQEIKERQGHGPRRLLSHPPFTSSPNSAIPLPQMPAVAALPLPWVSDQDKPDPWQKYVVKEIYPRFLYIFSDVVCYVTRNTKGAEEDMAQLIDWARNGHDLTTNQGMKPELIYIINQDNQPDFSQWKDTNFATKKILDRLQASKRFAQEQESWKHRGCQVTSVLQLLEKYYDSVQVVFLPEFLPRRPLCEAHEVQSQYQLLYNEIDRRSRAGAGRRRDAGLLMDLDQLSRHSVGVLTKLADNFHSPIDLYSMLDTLQPYPSNFKSHVLNFLAWFTDGERSGRARETLDPGYESAIIERVTPFVATCVAGEVTRNRQVGPETSMVQVVSNYTQEWKAILETFASTQCRCEEVLQGRACQNYEMTHVKGHQFRTGSISIITMSGNYISTFPSKILHLLERFQAELRRSLSTSGRDRRVWSSTLSQQARLSGAQSNHSNRTCLACLFRTPIHMLPCGHGVCEECAGDLGTNTTCETHAATLTRCPFGCSWTQFDVPPGGWTMRKKPTEAGVRILSLDGGGVRGILELVILQAIMDKIAFGIPIQELFDLVVGTSTGGIITLGIFKMGWTVEFAIRKFEELARQAFSQREFLKPVWFFPGARSSARLLCSHVYQSQGIETALKQSFGERTKLFGAASADGPELTKVAVVVTSEEDERPFLLTNYNRQWRVNDETNNNLRREERKEDELETWEAARCTSAAPTYFQPYRHAGTGRTYIDGSVEKNNPASIADSERKFIWPTTSSTNSRDILVSLGTGLSTSHSGEPVRGSRLSALLRPLERLSPVGKILMLRRVLENTTNGEKMWSEFRNSLGPDPGLGARCHRLNIPFGPGTHLGALDDVGGMAAMKGEALAVLARSSRHVAPRAQEEVAAQVAGVARQLVASLFYFQMTSVEGIQGGGSLCSGLLRCRLSRASRDSGLKMLAAAPVFRVWEEGSAGSEAQTTTLPALEWKEMTLSAPAVFRVWRRPSEVSIAVSFDGMKSWDDISGFPRAVGDVGDITLPLEPAEMP